MQTLALFALLAVLAQADGSTRPQPAVQVIYEAYAVRFGTLPQFRVSGLVAGADPARRLDIPVMVWLLKGSDGRRVLVDSGFYRQKFVDQWKVQDFRSPADAVTAAGVRPEEITDIIISHAHWDHVDGEDMLALLRINMQGRLRFVDGDDREPIPGIRCYTGGKHTWASQYVGVQTAGGTAVLTSDNVYLYENLEKHVPIAQTLDPASNLKAQKP